jgi:hypothetical protein
MVYLYGFLKVHFWYGFYLQLRLLLALSWSTGQKEHVSKPKALQLTKNTDLSGFLNGFTLIE